MPLNSGNGFGRSDIGRPGAAALIIAFVLFAGSWAAPSAMADVATHTVTVDPDVVAEGWSRQDLQSAEPAPMPAPPEAAFDVPSLDAGVSAKNGPFTPPDPTAYPERVQGKVFFDVGLNRYQCSGTLVNSAGGNVVYTAGHCVWDNATKDWVRNFVFIPGYANGTSPYSTYPATSLSTTSGFSRKGDLSYDIGMAVVDGNPEADLGGSRQIAFNLRPFARKYVIYGYPAEPAPPYNGEHLAGCRSTVALRDAGRPQPMGVTPCDMRQGASGGGWITDGNYLNSITSYTYCEEDPNFCNIIWGPYFSKAARALYTSDVTGGSVTPTLKVAFSPPRVVRKRQVLFKFRGTGSTPLSFQCRLDGRAFETCSPRTVIRGLQNGRHVLRVRSIDQTGHTSKKTIKRVFRVVVKNR